MERLCNRCTSQQKLLIMGPLVPLVASAAQGMANAFMQSGQNKKDREFAQIMDDRHRMWALEDWDRQNAYNSPASQMQRYKDAGLNPNLIYGQPNVVGPVRSSSGEAGSQRAPQLDIVNSMLQGFMAMYDLQKTQAQTDNLKAQVELTKANTRLTGINAENRAFDLSFKGDKRDFLLENLQQRNRNLFKQEFNLDASRKKIEMDTYVTGQRDSREAERLAMDLKLGKIKGAEALSRMATAVIQRQNMAVQRMAMEQNLENMKKDGTLKDFEIKLNAAGTSKGDTPTKYLTRLLAQFVDSLIF